MHPFQLRMLIVHNSQTDMKSALAEAKALDRLCNVNGCAFCEKKLMKSWSHRSVREQKRLACKHKCVPFGYACASKFTHNYEDPSESRCDSRSLLGFHWRCILWQKIGEHPVPAIRKREKAVCAQIQTRFNCASLSIENLYKIMKTCLTQHQSLNRFSYSIGRAFCNKKVVQIRAPSATFL